MRGQTHTVRRRQRCNTANLGHAAGAGDDLRNIERTAREQIVEIEARDLALPEAMGIVVARRTSETYDIAWFEEPVSPDRSLASLIAVATSSEPGASIISSTLGAA
jgi:hypothetical protein